MNAVTAEVRESLSSRRLVAAGEKSPLAARDHSFRSFHDHHGIAAAPCSAAAEQLVVTFKTNPHIWRLPS
jgi:hypothetical protein